MYHYVEDKQFLKRSKSLCSSFVKELEKVLRDEYDINSQPFLVGSGARNMVAQNGNEPIDFDYNLNIISCPNWNDGRAIKEAVRKAFNKVMRRHNQQDVEDSTSSLTTKAIYFTDSPRIKFKIDICIVTKNDGGQWERLIHDKTGFVSCDKYFWNLAPDSKNYQERANLIKSIPGWWEQMLRPKYIEKKNFYLGSGDKTHPSFICYIETVNDIYNTMRERHIL